MSLDKSKEPRPKFFKLVPKNSSSDICTCNSDESSSSPNLSLDRLVRSLINIWEPIKNLPSFSSQNSSFSCFSEKKVNFNSSPFITSNNSHKSKAADVPSKKENSCQNSFTPSKNIEIASEKGEASDELEEGEILDSSDGDILESSDIYFKDKNVPKVSTTAVNKNENAICSILNTYQNSEDEEDFSMGDLLTKNRIDLNISDKVSHSVDFGLSPESPGNLSKAVQKTTKYVQKSSQTDSPKNPNLDNVLDAEDDEFNKIYTLGSSNFQHTSTENCHSQSISCFISLGSKNNSSITSNDSCIASGFDLEKSESNNKRTRNTTFILSDSANYSEAEKPSKKVLFSDPRLPKTDLVDQLDCSAQLDSSLILPENSSQNPDLTVDLTELSSSDCEIVSVTYVVD